MDNKIILMKVTSRERPAILLETVRQYIEMANNTSDMVWLFSFDVDDQQTNSDKFRDDLRLVLPYGHRYNFYGDSKSKIEAINADVNRVDLPWQVILNISDDQRPIVKGYDEIIRKTMPDNLDASIWFFDGQDRVNTQEIVGLNYYNRFGYIYHPDYKSLWCDNESTDVAGMLDKQIKSSQQIVKHYHPAWNEGTPTDALYERNNKFWDEDEATFRRRQLINFDLK